MTIFPDGGHPVRGGAADADVCAPVKLESQLGLQALEVLAGACQDQRDSLLLPIIG